MEEEGEDGGEKLCRRLRRKMEFRENPDSGFVRSADGTKRLRMHLWHAKRFTMVKRCGFFLSLGLHGKGKGSRAVLKWLKTGTIIHDSSYCCPVEFEGPQDALLAVMKMVLVSSPTNLPDKTLRSIISGSHYGSDAPSLLGAPNSQFIVLVIYMWRPSSRDHGNVEVETNRVSNGCILTKSNNEGDTLSRQIWVWLHAATFNEGFDVLKSACLKQTNETGVTISCVSLEGQLAKFEIRGHKATETLQKILHPAPEPCSTSDSVLRSCMSLRSCSNFKFKKSSILENFKHIPCHAILSLEVCDHRDLHGERVKDIFGSLPSRPDNDDSNREYSDQLQFLVHSDLNERGHYDVVVRT